VGRYKLTGAKAPFPVSKKRLFLLTIQSKYVNMTDINYETASLPGVIDIGNETGESAPQTEALVAMAELLFFAYRDFTGDADEVLAEIGFGRAHHRILHFVTRRPGLRIAELLGILKITKQSLARVLRELIDKGYIVQKRGETDRRERLLYATSMGKTLAVRLAFSQAERLRQAMAAAGPHGAENVAHFLSQMVSGDEDKHFPAFAALIRSVAGAEDRTHRS